MHEISPLKHTADGSEIQLYNQLRLVDYPMIYDGFLYKNKIQSKPC